MAGEDEEEGSRDRGERGERESEEKAGTWAGRGGKDGDRGYRREGKATSFSETMKFSTGLHLILSLLSASVALGEGSPRRMNEFVMLEGHTVTDNYHSPLPHE